VIPEWADPKLSHELPELRARGESQELEFKSSFPDQARDLAREIAAFASTNTGRILLGVSNDGNLCGLPGVEDAAGRDRLIGRVQGLCRSSIKPAITPRMRFAIEDQKVVLVIEVPRGSEPLYYCGNVPYVRHVTEARPAEPHEVIARVRDWLAEHPEGHPEAAFWVRTASALTDALVYGHEVKDRHPHFPVQSAFREASSQLRALASEEVAESLQVAEVLRSLADQAEDVADFVLASGRYTAFYSTVETATDAFAVFKAEHIDPIPISDSSISGIKKKLWEFQKRLAELARRAERLLEAGRAEELRDEASSVGLAIARISHFGLHQLAPGARDALQSLGYKLHLVDIIGGEVSWPLRVMPVIEEVSSELQALLQRPEFAP
jgi:hypothetical protein